MRNVDIFESRGFRSVLLFTYTIGVLVFSQNSNAYSNFTTALDKAAKNLYGASASYTFSCNGCHGASGFTLATQFGKDFKASAVSIFPTTSITNLTDANVQDIVKNFETKDSDLDLAINKAEFAAGTNPADSASKPAPVCTRGVPSLIFSTSSLSTEPGSAVSYQLTLTNNDSIECSNSTFELLASMPTNISGNLSIQSLILAPAATQKFSVAVTPSGAVTAGTYNFGVKATNAGATSFFKESAANLVVLSPKPSPTPTPTPTATPSPTPTPTPTPVCVPKSPLVSLSPASQNAVPGDTKSFVLSVTNLDSAACGTVNFSLVAPAVTNLNLTLAKNSLSLNAGQNSNVNVSANIANTTATSQTLNFSINTSSATSALHSVSANGKINVTVATNVQDTEKPTEPTNLTVVAGHSRLKVSWDASTDNSGSVIYNVLVDGKVVAETNRTIVRMSLKAIAGANNLIIKAIDPSGNYFESKSFDLTSVVSPLTVKDSSQERIRGRR
jgi:uncharacterized membrane protein